MEISGFTIVRNAIKLKYPMRECLHALRAVSDEVVLGYDPYTNDGTAELAQELSQELDLKLFESKWDMDNIKEGTELGIQTQLTMAQCSNDWALYAQMDEAFHQDDKDALHALIARDDDVTGFSFVRPYFWKDLHTIRKDWSPQLVRLTRRGTHDYTTLDGHSCITQRGRVELAKLWLYHYSRIGEASDISYRVRNLDGFYHEEENLISRDELPDYDWGTRQWDNYSKIETPPRVKGEFVRYDGTHPLPFAELYSGYE